MKKIPKPAYTTEFKELAVKRVTDGQATRPLSAHRLRGRLSCAALDRWISEQHQEKLAA